MILIFVDTQVNVMSNTYMEFSVVGIWVQNEHLKQQTWWRGGKVPYLGGGGLELYGNTLAKQELV
jgi:hypothetical protein